MAYFCTKINFDQYFVWRLCSAQKYIKQHIRSFLCTCGNLWTTYFWSMMVGSNNFVRKASVSGKWHVQMCVDVVSHFENKNLKMFYLIEVTLRHLCYQSALVLCFNIKIIKFVSWVILFFLILLNSDIYLHHRIPSIFTAALNGTQSKYDILFFTYFSFTMKIRYFVLYILFIHNESRIFCSLHIINSLLLHSVQEVYSNWHFWDIQWRTINVGRRPLTFFLF